MEAVRQRLLVVRGAFALAAMDATEPERHRRGATDLAAGRGHRARRDVSGQRRARDPGPGEGLLRRRRRRDRATRSRGISRHRPRRARPFASTSCRSTGTSRPPRRAVTTTSCPRRSTSSPTPCARRLLDRRRDDGTHHLRRDAHQRRGAARGEARRAIVAAGTSYHAALIAKYAIERWARLGVDVDISSEYRYRDPIVEIGTLVIGVSQSGETIDTIQAIARGPTPGAHVVAISNIVDSSLAREADAVIYTRAGLEVSVASTKAFVAQVAALESWRCASPNCAARCRRRDRRAVPGSRRRERARSRRSLDRRASVEDVAKELIGRARLLLHRPPRRVPHRARRRAQTEGAHATCTPRATRPASSSTARSP